MTAARRFLPADPADFLRSIVPLALLGLAAVTPDARLVVLALLVLGTVIAARRTAPVRWAWAGAVPAAAMVLMGPPGLLGWPTPACPDPGRGLVDHELWRALVAGGTVLALALVLRAQRSSIALRWPSRAFAGWVPLGALLAFGLGVALMPWWLFGGWPNGFPGIAVESTGVGLALVYGIGSAVADELAYRGALLHWSARVIGIGPAVVGQAVVFGLVPGLLVGDATAAVPVMLAGGLLGIIAVRTRSLAVVLALHAGLSAASYLLLAAPPSTSAGVAVTLSM